ncbi:DsbA family oxidoreductase [Sphingomonas sp. NSE70-1]|uniref:DsbA family oxidoreductase n=1 Tax=Sphingomonas caseinilyticus TaxID=2908205 RepID=A0ABT0RWC9_9SPHN|nr:DsbA family oxidoreductase [Sphingomonas caseinilyticus]MCL6699327.1 DsbA family oxidoreductase [Sphingomonas caseinilyticus]
MSKPIKIDFVSDVSCPWCVIGLKGLEQALERVPEVQAEVRFQPFELNPNMPPEGQRLVDYAAQKYGSTPEQLAERRAMVRERAGDLGFTIALPPEEGRVYNTFDAHRLLHWAGQEGRQRELKLALFDAYFTQCLNPADHGVLADAAEKAGLDREAAAALLSSHRFAREVREEEEQWRAKGINAVPAVIINDRYLISGGQPSEVFEQAIRKIAAEGAEAPAA